MTAPCPACRGRDGVHGPGCSRAPRPPRPPAADEGRCRHELLPGQCALCRPAPSAPAGDGDDIVATFSAQYDGRCADCGERFEVGERVGKLRDGGYVCPGCLG